MILVNTPAIFDNVLKAILPLVSPSSRKALVIMGHDKNKWKSHLLDEIDADQLPIDLGGTKPDDF